MRMRGIIAVVLCVILLGGAFFGYQQQLYPFDRIDPEGILGKVIDIAKTYTKEFIDLITTGIKELFGIFPETTSVAMGESVTVDDIKLTVSNFEIVESDYAAEGADYLFVYFKAENFGEVAHTPPYKYSISLMYKGRKIYPELSWKGVSYRVKYDPDEKIYPGVTKEGWLCYEVPEDIDLSDGEISITYKGDTMIWDLK